MSCSIWKEYKLSDLMTIIGGGTPKTGVPEYWGGDIPWLSVKDFAGDKRYVSETEKTITKKGLENSSTKILNKGDIIISARGTVGEVAQLQKDMAFNQSCYGLKANEKTTNDFLYYLMKFVVRELKNKSHGSVFDTITRKTFENVSVKLPPLDEQDRITKLLSSLDNKIQLNNETNQTLEQIAQAIFKHWFYDFEFPNENGEPYKSSGGKFVESEMGMIPEGWRVGTIEDIGTVVGGGTPSKKKGEYYTEKGIPWITPKDLSKSSNRYISRGAIDITEEGFKNSSTKLLPEGTVLFSSRAPIGYIAIAKNEVTTNQGFKSVVPNENISSEFVYQVLKHKKDFIENRASGSTFKEISGGELRKIPLIIPDNYVIQKFNETTKALGELIKFNEEQNEVLTNIRDTFLPKLMSGEIRVPEAEEVVESCLQKNN